MASLLFCDAHAQGGKGGERLRRGEAACAGDDDGECALGALVRQVRRVRWRTASPGQGEKWSPTQGE
eukprot:5797441-Pleurochrysis_carterae.AAC.2